MYLTNLRSTFLEQFLRLFVLNYNNFLHIVCTTCRRNSAARWNCDIYFHGGLAMYVIMLGSRDYVRTY